MKIRKEGIYKTIDSKDFGVYQKSGWEKVVVDEEPKKVVAPKPVVKETFEPIDEEKIEEVNNEEKSIEELPKSKKKKNK